MKKSWLYVMVGVVVGCSAASQDLGSSDPSAADPGYFAKQEYLKIKFSDVLVSSYQTGGSQGDVLPMDQVSMNFSKIEMEYKAQKADGTLDAPTKAGWDLKGNVKI